MLKFREYVRAESLEDAYVRNQKKSAHILGGMLWLKMQNRTVQTVIDLSDLGLSGIEETEEEYRIGAMTSLRELELHKGLDAMTGGAVRESLRHIVGVQFRNLATVGGSIFGRFGFSDVLTMFLALDSWVELYHGGLVPMERFAAEGAENDILVRVIVKKEKRRYAYLSHRNTKTDFPVMACAVAVGEGWRSGLPDGLFSGRLRPGPDPMSFRQNGWNGSRPPERKNGRLWLRSLHLWSPRAAISGRERNSAAIWRAFSCTGD